MIEGWRLREGDLTHDLRPYVERCVGAFPRFVRQCRPEIGGHEGYDTLTGMSGTCSPFDAIDTVTHPRHRLYRYPDHQFAEY